MTNKAKEFKRLYSQRGTICDYCRSEDYCPSDCKFIEKAKTLTDKQWEDISQKYDIDDIGSVVKSIKNRKKILKND